MFELVPIVSFLALRGRCRGCDATIAPMHLHIELAATLVPALLLALEPEASWPVLASGSVLGWGLLTLAWIDLLDWRLPDALTLPLLVIGLAATWSLSRDAIVDHAAGCVIAAGGLAALRAVYQRVRGREGLGLGDVKLLAAGAAWDGTASLPYVLLGAALAGLAFALARHGRSAATSTAIPFGPPLCLAIWAGWIVQWSV